MSSNEETLFNKLNNALDDYRNENDKRKKSIENRIKELDDLKIEIKQQVSQFSSSKLGARLVVDHTSNLITTMKTIIDTEKELNRMNETNVKNLFNLTEKAESTNSEKEDNNFSGVSFLKKMENFKKEIQLGIEKKSIENKA